MEQVCLIFDFFFVLQRLLLDFFDELIDSYIRIYLSSVDLTVVKGIVQYIHV